MNYIIFIICSIIIPIIALNQNKPKLCINCKYFIPDTITNNGIFSKCSYFPKKEGEIHFLVNGIINKYENNYCSTSRDNDTMCGKHGKYYTPKTKECKKNIVTK